MRTLNDVPVQVQYTNATYAPMVVRKIVDVGPDPAKDNLHKVLLDGVTPAWGEWKHNEAGVPQFVVNQTQASRVWKLLGKDRCRETTTCNW